MFYQNNTRPRVSLTIRQKLLELDWDVLPYPTYSTDIAHSLYKIFLMIKTLTFYYLLLLLK